MGENKYNGGHNGWCLAYFGNTSNLDTNRNGPHCTVKQQGAFCKILIIYLNCSLVNITVHDSAQKEQIHICLVVCNFWSRPI